MASAANAASPEKEPLVAPEGLPFYLTPAIIGLILLVVGWSGVGIFLLVLAVAIALFFRNPRRHTPDDDSLLISPADGIIMSVGAAEADKIPGQRSRRVTIFLSVLDVHVNRYPCDGEVEAVAYNPGKFLAAFNEKASLENEQQSTLLKTKRGLKVMVVQIAGLIARRIVCYAEHSQQVQVGKLMGLIRFGSRVDIWIPEQWKIVVKPGQRMRGGETIVALMKA